MVTEESLNTASVTNRSESWAGFATNADFGLFASGVGSCPQPPHLKRANVVVFCQEDLPSYGCLDDADSAPVAKGIKGGPQLS